MSMPNYYSFSNKELEFIYLNMDKESYPERYKVVSYELRKRGMLNLNSSNVSIKKSQYEQGKPYTAQAPKPRYNKKGKYIPNKIPHEIRVNNAVGATLLIAYGGFTLYTNKFYIPGKSDALVLTDDSVVIMFFAIFCAAIKLVIQVLDHYDKRDNERTYYSLARVAQNAGYILFFIALLNAYVY